MIPFHTRLFGAAVALTLAAGSPALSQQLELKLMAPAAPGGGWDQTARSMQQALVAAKIARSVQVINVAGAGGSVGIAQFVNGAKGDGNQMMVNGFVMVGALAMNKSPVTLDQVTPIARLTEEIQVIVVPANSPIKTMADLVKAFKADPGKVSWGGGSAGGTDHILIGLIAKATGADSTKINYVPFKGGGEAVAAIVGGHVTAGVSGLGEFSEQIKGGRLRALALSSAQREEGIPTLKEQGIDVELGNWRGVFAAPGITTAQRDALVKLVQDATNTPAWKATLEKLGWAGVFLGGDQYKTFVEEDTKRIAAIIDSLGIKKK
jgi:putative tricarboxylic transport membrane protein